MCRSLRTTIGILEMLLAGILCAVAWQLPYTPAVHERFDNAGHVADTAEKQVQLMRSQVCSVRQKDFPRLARQLRQQTDTVALHLQASSIDFATVEAMSQALGAAAQGLNGWSETLDTEKYLPIAHGLADIADVLDGRGRRERSGVDREARQLIEWLRQPPPAWETGEIVWTVLRYVLHRQSWDQLLQDRQLLTSCQGLLEMEAALTSAIERLEVISSASFPVATPFGFEMRPVWPEGARTIQGLQQALAVVQQINRDLDSATALLPTLLVSIENYAVMPLDRVKKIVSKAGRIDEIAASLRHSQLTLERTLRTWPELVDTMRRSSVVLEGSRRQLESALAQKAQYQLAMNSSRQMTRSAEDVLESSTDEFDQHLKEQEQALGQLASGLDEFNRAIPEGKQTTAKLLYGLRLFLWSIGGLIGVHGLCLSIQARLRR